MDYPFKKENNNNIPIINKSRLGISLEQDISLTNKFYRENNIALIFKNAIPIKIVKVEYPKRSKAKITEAYFNSNSLPDYHGIYKGNYLSFDVKETNNKSIFNLSNIPNHQIETLKEIKKFKGLSFFIIHFKVHKKYFIVPIKFVLDYLKNNHSKSINYKIFEKNLLQINLGYYPRLDYLKIIDKLIK
ncbi:Holliday junction resolvase RecU [Candidatus Phytoplasma palmae]|uniref:Holliday junction resolvase RecU n=1 Tax=Candidatus Phytoplasma palmae TaxID=85624 RepID=UPI0039906204